MSELYHGVNVVERTEVKPSGKIEKLYRVSAYTANESYFTIAVKEKDFTKETVAKLLTAKATEIAAIEAL